MPVSQTEKRGVSSGCCFGDRAGHLPIKKRRFLLRSPSPPPTQTSSCAEETSNHTRSQYVSNENVQSSSSNINLSKIIDTNDGIDAKKLDNSNERFPVDEDFSGISILAAAACSSSLGRDCGYADEAPGFEDSSVMEQTQEASIIETRSISKVLSKEDVFNSSELSSGATSSCISTEPLAELAPISTTVNSDQKVVAVGKVSKDASSGVDSLNSSRDACVKDEVRNQRPSLQDDRLHWDLNVVMDAWEQPFDDPGAQIDVSHSISQDVGKSDYDDNRKIEGLDLQDNLKTACATVSCLLPGEPRLSGNPCSEEIKDKHDMDGCSNLKQPLCSGKMSLSANSDHNSYVMKCISENTNCGHQDGTMISTDGLVGAAPNQMTEVSATCSIFDAKSSSVKNVNLNDDGVVYEPVVEGLTSSFGISSCQLQNLATFNAVAADTNISLCVSLEPDTPKEVEQNVVVPEFQEKLMSYNHEGKSHVDGVDLKTVSPLENANFAKSDDKRSPYNAIPCSMSKRSLVVGADVAGELQEDYNSQCEDGELRGSGRRAWEGFEVVDREVEFVDHVSNYRETHAANRSDYGSHISLCVSSKSDTLKEVKQNMIPELQEMPKNEGKSVVENVDMKTVELLENSEFSKLHNNDNAINSSVSERSLVVGADVAVEFQEDYDSQYEDGELRESGGRVWEECEALDREVEFVDYVSNYRETHTAHQSDYHVSECSQVDDINGGRLIVAPAGSSHDSNTEHEFYGKVVEVVGDERGLDEVNKLRLSHVVEETESTQEKLIESFTDLGTPGADDNGIDTRMPAHFDVLLDSQSTETRAEPKAFRGVVQSHVEAPGSRSETYKEDQLKKIENRFEPGPMRYIEKMRYPFNNQGRGRQGGSWDGSSDGRKSFRRHYSPIIHGHSKLDDDAVMERDDIECAGDQEDASYSQQPFPKSRVGSEGDPCAGFQSRYKTDRKFSPDRAGGFGRGRPFRYGPFNEGRGGRGRFNGRSPDETFQSSFKYRRPFSRRERSISPFGGRGQSNIHHSRRKSPSQSRSRSPVWNSPWRRLGAGRGGNTFLGHRSRSPTYRPEARMQRLRSPPQQPGFSVDHAGGFRSISRQLGSPPRNRWSSARKDEQGQFREVGYKQRDAGLDRSPGRMRLRGDRGSDVDSPRSLKADGYYRISDRVPDDAGRGVRYEGNFEDRRKQYNHFRPARRNYDDGMASRLRLDNNDSFSIANDFRDRDNSSFQGRGLRNIDSRVGDVPRRFRGENQSFSYDRDGKFNSISN